MNWWREFQAWRKAIKEAREAQLVQSIKDALRNLVPNATDYFAAHLINIVREHDRRGIR